MSAEPFDVLVSGGTVYDGTGGAPLASDVGIVGDTIVAVGDLSVATARTVVDARGLAVAPGFINMLSWSVHSLIADGRSQGEIRQGVTTEIFGEGFSFGPLNAAMKERMRREQGDIQYDITWTTLAEYLGFLEKKGISPNVASFIGAETVRQHVLGLEDKAPSPKDLDRMRDLVRAEMQAGALGIASSLIYAPGAFAKSEELVELCRAAAERGGMYISHLRSEGDRLLEAVDELIRISREGGLPAEIYHLKAVGEHNWPKMDRLIEKVEEARAQGLRITANMYPYTAGATSLTACMPPWSQDGGLEALFARLSEPETRRRIGQEMRTPGLPWENLCLAAGTPERILLAGFKSQALKPLVGKTLAEVSGMQGRDWAETAMELVLEDRSGLGAIFFMMSEENVRKQIKLPWVSFGSDTASIAPVGVFLKSSTHPRAYGAFARVLGRYVREEGLIPLSEAIRRLTGFPAGNVGLDRRGLLKPGMFADVVIFDPNTIIDRASFEDPHRYAVGMRHVFVNGVAVLRDGEHTGALPGRALRRRQSQR